MFKVFLRYFFIIVFFAISSCAKRGTITGGKKDTIAPILTTEKIKEYLQLAGKLSLDNDKNTPLKNKTVKLLNKKGEVISTSQTTNHGAFDRLTLTI